MISPLKEQIEAGKDIPPFTKLTFEHRRRWTCNRCFRSLYSVFKALYLGTWFYYIPFLALTVNFSTPFLASFAGEYVDDSVAGEMSAEQIALIEAAAAGRAKDPENDYVEPSIPELIQMMEAIPLITDEWKQDPEILVSPMSLEDFWSCFWADDAPYYVEAI